MSKRLKGQSAVVTGAGQGIGRAIVESFAREGCRVWATSRSLEPLASIERAPLVRIEQLDVTLPEAVAGVAAKIGAVDILVNCAGYVASGSILDCAPDELERSLAVNLKGAYYMIRAFLPGMCDRGAGAIINIASVLSSITSAPGRFAYTASKAALVGLTKSVAVDFAGRGIRANALCPGTIRTPGLESRIAASEDPDATRSAFIARHKLGRLGTVSEVAEACVFLAAADGGFVTGQTLIVDGGMTL